jgi:3-oxoacyl-[acyl-carrier-protein] synthase-3
VPESGRFTVSYLKMTVVGPEAVVRIADRHPAAIPDAPLDLGPLRPELMSRATPLQQQLIRELSLVWLDFERRLRNTPLFQRLERGTFTLEDYKTLLRNLRQQVMEGGRWIARAASSITIEHFELRSAFIHHAQEEHRDYQMLERDYVAVGGSQEEILNAPKNVGSEAFSAYMFHQAGRENPIDLLGAMFIIEGLGNRLAASWAERIRDVLGLTREQVSFLAYHGVNDEHHLAKLEEVLTGSIINEETVPRIVKTAKVVARLYRLQIEELDNT